MYANTHARTHKQYYYYTNSTGPSLVMASSGKAARFLPRGGDLALMKKSSAAIVVLKTTLYPHSKCPSIIISLPSYLNTLD